MEVAQTSEINLLSELLDIVAYTFYKAPNVDLKAKQEQFSKATILTSLARRKEPCSPNDLSQDLNLPLNQVQAAVRFFSKHIRFLREIRPQKTEKEKGKIIEAEFDPKSNGTTILYKFDWKSFLYITALKIALICDELTMPVSDEQEFVCPNCGDAYDLGLNFVYPQTSEMACQSCYNSTGKYFVLLSRRKDLQHVEASKDSLLICSRIRTLLENISRQKKTTILQWVMDMQSQYETIRINEREWILPVKEKYDAEKLQSEISMLQEKDKDRLARILAETSGADRLGKGITKTDISQEDMLMDSLLPPQKTRKVSSYAAGVPPWFLHPVGLSPVGRIIIGDYITNTVYLDREFASIQTLQLATEGSLMNNFLKQEKSQALENNFDHLLGIADDQDPAKDLKIKLENAETFLFNDVNLDEVTYSTPTISENKSASTSTSATPMSTSIPLAAPKPTGAPKAFNLKKFKK